MKSFFVTSIAIVAMLFSLAPARAQEFQFPDLSDFFDSLEEFEQAMEETQNITCELEATNRISAAGENTLNVKLSYTSPGVIQNTPFDIEVFGSEGVIFSLISSASLEFESGYLELEPGKRSIDIPFDTVKNQKVTIQTSIGSKACGSQQFDAINPSAFGLPNIFVPNQNPNLQAGTSGEVEQESEAEANVPGNLLPGNFIPEQAQQEEDNPSEQQNEQPAEAINAGQGGSLPSECRVVAEARVSDNTFRILSALAYTNFSEGSEDFTLIASRPNGSRAQTLNGTEEINRSGALSNNGELFEFVFPRTQEEQQLVVNAQLGSVICSSALFIDSGVSAESNEAAVSGSANAQNTEAERQILPEGSETEDIVLLEQIEEGDEMNEYNPSSRDYTEDQDMDWKFTILVILGIGILGLLAMLLIKKDGSAQRM